MTWKRLIGISLSILALLFTANAKAQRRRDPAFFSIGTATLNTNSYQFASPANTLNVWSPFKASFDTSAASVAISTLCFYVSVADRSGRYNIGIYDSNDALVADIGAQSLPNTGWQCAPVVQRIARVTNGARYRVATTGTSTTARINYSSATLPPAADQGYYGSGTTSGGALPASITAATFSPQEYGYFPVLGMY